MPCALTWAVPARRQCDLGSGDSRSFDHGLRPAITRGCRFGYRYQQHSGTTGKRGLHHTLFWSPQIAHVHVNWLTPVKVRHTLIGGSDKMILYDDLEPSEKVKVYDKGVTFSQSPEDVYEMLVSYRSGTCGRRVWTPPKRCRQKRCTSLTAFETIRDRKPMGRPAWVDTDRGSR